MVACTKSIYYHDHFWFVTSWNHLKMTLRISFTKYIAVIMNHKQQITTCFMQDHMTKLGKCVSSFRSCGVFSDCGLLLHISSYCWYKTFSAVVALQIHISWQHHLYNFGGSIKTLDIWTQHTETSDVTASPKRLLDLKCPYILESCQIVSRWCLAVKKWRRCIKGSTARCENIWHISRYVVGLPMDTILQEHSDIWNRRNLCKRVVCYS